MFTILKSNKKIILKTYIMMRTDNELQQMSHDELIEQVKGLQFQLAGMELAEKENARMREILSAIGIIYESYKTDCHE
jgi:hypothetical protein